MSFEFILPFLRPIEASFRPTTRRIATGLAPRKELNYSNTSGSLTAFFRSCSDPKYFASLRIAARRWLDVALHRLARDGAAGRPLKELFEGVVIGLPDVALRPIMELDRIIIVARRDKVSG